MNQLLTSSVQLAVTNSTTTSSAKGVFVEDM
jgi:hypothetical protein